MRKIFDFILLALLFAFLFWQKDKIVGNFNFLLASPCDRPISYRLGEIDKGYGLTKEQFLTDVGEADKIWSSVVAKNLFKFDPNGKIVVNLIYSERQSMADNLNKLEGNLQSGKESLDSLTVQYQNLKADFENKLAAFNQEVLSWNRRGGAPEDEFNRLKAQQDELKGEADKLNNLAQKLNLSVEQYNLGVSEFNQNAQNLNLAIKEKPEEGLYDGSVPKIDIYLTSSKTELIHTLAHELGHALGLAHTNNPNSIMYPWTNKVIKPDSQESESLKIYCEQTNFGLRLEQIRKSINQRN